MSELDDLVSDPKLYDDSCRAGNIVKERAKIDAKLERVERLKSELQTWREMHGELRLLPAGTMVGLKIPPLSKRPPHFRKPPPVIKQTNLNT